MAPKKPKEKQKAVKFIKVSTEVHTRMKVQAAQSGHTSMGSYIDELTSKNK